MIFKIEIANPFPVLHVVLVNCFTSCLIRFFIFVFEDLEAL